MKEILKNQEVKWKKWKKLKKFFCLLQSFEREMHNLSVWMQSSAEREIFEQKKNVFVDMYESTHLNQQTFNTLFYKPWICIIINLKKHAVWYWSWINVLYMRRLYNTYTWSARVWVFLLFWLNALNAFENFSFSRRL